MSTSETHSNSPAHDTKPEESSPEQSPSSPMSASIDPAQAERLAQSFRASWEPAADSSAPGLGAIPAQTAVPRGLVTGQDALNEPSVLPIQRTRKRYWFLATAALVLAAAAIFSLKPSEREPAVDPTNSNAQSEQPPAKPTEDSTEAHSPIKAPAKKSARFAISVRTVPEDAELKTAGQIVSNPYVAQVAKGDKLRFTASAEGYLTQEKTLTAKESLTLAIELEREAQQDNSAPSQQAQEPEQSDLIRLQVRTVPRRATLWLDGAIIDNPYSGTLPEGGRHELLATADGYEDRRSTFRADRDTVTVIRLRPKVVRRPAPAKRPAAAPSSDIVTDNPY